MKFDKQEDPQSIIIGLSEKICHVGPGNGTIRFECGAGASANTVNSISSEVSGILSVFTSTGEHREYKIHQTKATFPSIPFQEVTTEEYEHLQSKR